MKDIIEAIDYELGYLVGEPRYYSSTADERGEYDIKNVVERIRELLKQLDGGK